VLSAHRAALGGVHEISCGLSAASRWVGGYRPGPRRAGFVDSPAAPVVLVHGLCANKSFWAPMAKHLARAGHPVVALNYSWAGTSIRQCGDEVADQVERIARSCGSGKVHLVGHSLGGVVLKWAVHNTSLGVHAERVVTLGAPHQGTPWSGLKPLGLVPGVGGLISQLGSSMEYGTAQSMTLPPHVQWVTVGGGLDMLVPASRAALARPAGPHHVFEYLGHVAMVSDRRVMSLVETTFAPAGVSGALATA
jgi:triacylglycerol lipase